MHHNASSRWTSLLRNDPESTSAADRSNGISRLKGPKVWHTTIEDRVPSWPDQAKALKQHTWISYLYGIGDVLLALLPIYFILLGVASVMLHGKPTNGNTFGPKVETAMSLGPTMFPILFAAISGRSMKMVARYLAERGAKLSTLELMMASQSVWGTFESQLLMQRLTLVGVNLLFLWALSPLGGQASLRLMRRDLEASFTPVKLRYASTGPGSAFAISATNQKSKYAEAGSIFNAAILTPHATKIGPRDLWGNVKIPRLELLDMNKTDPEGWLPFPENPDAPELYSSLVGLPIAGLPGPDIASNFTVEYNYVYVVCGAWEVHPYPGLHGTGDPSATDYKKLDQLVPGIQWYNKSVPSLQPFDPIGARASFLIDTTMTLSNPMGSEGPPKDYDIYVGRLDAFMGNYNRSRFNTSMTNAPRELVFASVYGTSRDGNDQNLNIAKCSLRQTHVEAWIDCRGSQCVAPKIRKSMTDKRPTTVTAFESNYIMFDFVRQFPTAIRFNEGSSPTELFMANTSAFPFPQRLGSVYPDQMYADLSKLSPDIFSRRLSLTLNTYAQLTSQSTGYFSGLTSNLSAYGPDTLPASDIDAYLPANFSATNHSFYDWFGRFQVAMNDAQMPFMGATTTSQTRSEKEIFVCNFAWFALLIASSSTILFTGGVAVVLKRKTLGPEMFGFVSSMTYENPWVKIPKGGSMLDAMERTRLLKDMEVFVGDVQGGDDVGHIAFAAGVPVRKLERGRLYH